jgi:hypothetical protein
LTTKRAVILAVGQPVVVLIEDAREVRRRARQPQARHIVRQRRPHRLLGRERRLGRRQPVQQRVVVERAVPGEVRRELVEQRLHRRVGGLRIHRVRRLHDHRADREQVRVIIGVRSEHARLRGRPGQREPRLADLQRRHDLRVGQRHRVLDGHLLGDQHARPLLAQVTQHVDVDRRRVVADPVERAQGQRRHRRPAADLVVVIPARQQRDRAQRHPVDREFAAVVARRHLELLARRLPGVGQR